MDSGRVRLVWMVGKCRGHTLLNDPDALAEADPYDLAKVLTVIWGREHQKNGYIAEAYGNGLLLSVLHRAKVLSATAPF